MPNWCENKIEFSGKKENMKPVVDILRKIENTDNPVMESLLGLDDKPENYENGGWYDYNVKKFGTKWDFCFNDDDVYYSDISDTKIRLDVSTAWAPPIRFLENLCKKYKINGVLFYKEPGMDFGGVAKCDENGETGIEEYSYHEATYNLFPEQFFNTIQFDIEFAVEDGKTFNDFIEDFNFLNEDDIKKIKKMYEIELNKVK